MAFVNLQIPKNHYKMRGQDAINKLGPEKAEEIQNQKSNYLYSERGDGHQKLWMPKRTVWPVVNVSERNPLTDRKHPKKTFFLHLLRFLVLCVIRYAHGIPIQVHVLEVLQQLP